jgi:hypothetical protein
MNTPNSLLKLCVFALRQYCLQEDSNQENIQVIRTTVEDLPVAAALWKDPNECTAQTIEQLKVDWENDGTLGCSHDYLPERIKKSKQLFERGSALFPLEDAAQEVVLRNGAYQYMVDINPACKNINVKTWSSDAYCFL